MINGMYEHEYQTWSVPIHLCTHGGGLFIYLLCVGVCCFGLLWVVGGRDESWARPRFSRLCWPMKFHGPCCAKPRLAGVGLGAYHSHEVRVGSCWAKCDSSFFFLNLNKIQKDYHSWPVGHAPLINNLIGCQRLFLWAVYMVWSHHSCTTSAIYVAS